MISKDIYILYTKDNHYLMNMAIHISLLNSRNVNSGKCPCADKYYLRIFRENIYLKPHNNVNFLELTEEKNTIIKNYMVY